MVMIQREMSLKLHSNAREDFRKAFFNQQAADPSLRRCRY